jgi:hypothetical protein
MSHFNEMNDTANKKLLDHVHRKHMRLMIDVASLEYKNLQLVKSLGSQERMIDSLTSLNVGTAYTVSSLMELIDEKDKVRAIHHA